MNNKKNKNKKKHNKQSKEGGVVDNGESRRMHFPSREILRTFGKDDESIQPERSPNAGPKDGQGWRSAAMSLPHLGRKCSFHINVTIGAHAQRGLR